jgi:hypothetical protein
VTFLRDLGFGPRLTSDTLVQAGAAATIAVAAFFGAGNAQQLAGTTAGTSTTTAAATVARPLAGASAGTSTTTGALTVIVGTTPVGPLRLRALVSPRTLRALLIPRTLVANITPRRLVKVPRETAMIRGDDETIELQLLAGEPPAAVNLAGWTDVTIETSQDQQTWVPRATTIANVAQGRVTAKLSRTDTAALSVGWLYARVRGVDPSADRRTFPDSGGFERYPVA